MDKLPKLRRQADRRNITFAIDEDVKALYELAKQNGWDSSEIARRAVTKAFKDRADELKRPAS